MKTNTEAIQFLNALVSNIDSGIISFDIEGYVTLINSRAIQFLNLEGTTKDIIDTEVLPNIKIDKLYDLIQGCLLKTRKEFHITNILFNGKHLIIDGKKLLDGMLITLTDITADVLSKHQATQSLLLGQETERRRLAKEIHDGLGPNMSTLKLQIDAVKRKLTDETAKLKLEKVNEAISEIASDIRQISHDLMPSSLIDFGVATALFNFTNKISDSGQFAVEYNCNLEDNDLSTEYELNIYRIIQELVNNAIKYSQCSTIEINIKKNEKVISIFVNDDGIGMDDTNINSGIGIHNIKTRVKSLQGKFILDSQKGGGVTAHIELPLKSESLILN